MSAFKEIFEDVKRRRSDHKVNSYPIEVLVNGSWEECQWKHVKVGDIVRVNSEGIFPADLLLLSSSEQQGMAYIETSNLDGETNLKIKQAPSNTAHLTSPELLADFKAEITCEQPSRHVNEFNGNLKIGSDERHFGIDELLLRGARLKNTEWIFGLVIYTGHDSKLLMNSTLAPLKTATIDKKTNIRIIFLFIVLLSLAAISALGSQWWMAANLPNAWYLEPLANQSMGSFMWNVLTFFILYNNLIPISLQITLEMVRFFQAIYINNDIEMYDVNSDSCAIAKTSNLNEELGLVKFVMSDKTGTLTRNVMLFKRLSINDVNYGNNEDDQFQDPKLLEDYNKDKNSSHSKAILEMLTMMAVCHTVVPEKKDGKINYQASSPDEGALVKGAASQDVVFHTRQPQKVTCKMFGKDETFEILDVIDFTSDRKRMSVIVKNSKGNIKLYMKGAETAIFERLKEGSERSVDNCSKHLENYASFGYRTLCFAMKDIPKEEYDQWAPAYKKATLAIDNRATMIAEVAERIEKEMTLIGATAIEDKLQEWVPETIHALLAAGIRVWMLTGDKRETAINIAHSCSLCDSQTELLIVDKSTFEETFNKLTQLVERAEQFEHEGKNFAMVIDGKSLVHALIGECRKPFGQLALRCHSVVCCRMSPMQKAEVVEMVRQITNMVVLAIGDGANDVAMIQASNVGIGICGEEGLQAAGSSDYAIPRFHYLRRLLFIHGAWNHDRSVKCILYSFYKNICLYIIELWFAIFSAWSGQTIFDRWTIGLFNVVFTAWPPLIIGLFDRPVPPETMMKYPALYSSLQNKSFSIPNFCLWLGLGIVHSILLFFLTFEFLRDGIVWENGRAGGWLMLGNCAYTFVVVTVCLKAILESDTWNLPMVVSSVGSILLWLGAVIVYSLIFPTLGSFGADMAGMAYIMMSSPSFWLAFILIPFATLLADIVIKSLFTIARPTPRELAVMHSKRNSSFHGFERLASQFAAHKSPPESTMNVFANKFSLKTRKKVAPSIYTSLFDPNHQHHPSSSATTTQMSQEKRRESDMESTKSAKDHSQTSREYGSMEKVERTSGGADKAQYANEAFQMDDNVTRIVVNDDEVQDTRL